MKKEQTQELVPLIHAKWLVVETGRDNFRLYCSNCNKSGLYPHNYCPDCGAKMEGSVISDN